jgi:hypothetical protein
LRPFSAANKPEVPEDPTRESRKRSDRRGRLVAPRGSSRNDDRAAAFSRQNTELAARRPFYCYLDEFENFSSMNMFSEFRKYRIGMIVVHQ